MARRGPPSSSSAERSREPSFLVWLVAIISLILPFVGIPLGLWGMARLAAGDAYGWALLAGGVGFMALDVWIDFVWAKSPAGASDYPALTMSGAGVIGRIAIVTQPIVDGRGKVRLGDTLWIAEGADQPEGAAVRIVGIAGTVLRVAADNKTAG